MDAGHAYTDDEIERLEKRINEAYSQAYTELQAKQSEFLREYEALRQEQLALLEEGTITKAQFNANMTRSMQTEKWYKQMVSTYADQLTCTDQIAAGMINGSLSNVFAENMDFGTYQVEEGSGVNTMYTLTDAQTVTNLIKDEPNLLPTLEIDGNKATRWHKQTVTSAITQSVLQGESVDKAAKRLQSVVGMSASAARTNARTALNSAQNSGRQKSYERAQSLGLEFKKMWLATADGRTRSSHRVADGQTVGVNEMFEVGSSKMEHPGDAQNGRPEELYNCRCTVVAVFSDEQRENLLGIRDETSDLLKGQSYDEWKKLRTTNGR